MSEAEKDRYLWDKQGEPDPEVQALEKLLAPLAHDGRPLAKRRRPPRIIIIALATAALASAAAWLLVAWQRPEAPADLSLTVASGGKVRSGEWIDAKSEQRLVLGNDVARLTLAAGSRLQVKSLGQDETKLYLEKGELGAFVNAYARPRFFQVETPATTCVDLGCEYTLTVDDAGASVVVVKTGRVMFENGARELFIPAGAICRAAPGKSWTPRFKDTPAELAAALDAFDKARAADERRALAVKVLALAKLKRDALGPWHFLQDDDLEIALAARSRLLELCGFRPEQVAQARAKGRPDAKDREDLRRLFVRDWGTW